MAVQGEPITILGAGVAGLAAAAALAMKGARVTVLEQADAVREVGAGLQVSPNGAVVMHALGLGEALSDRATKADAVHLYDGHSGDKVLKLDLARLKPDQGYHFIHRADLIQLLLNRATDLGVDLKLLQKIDTIDLSGQKPRLITALGVEIPVDFVIGADGLHSKLRMALNGTVAPFFTHQVAWRGIVPAEPDAPSVAEVHMGSGRHLVSYPMRGGTLRNIVAVEERRTWAEESWTLRDDPMELRLAFESFSPRVRNWLDQLEDVWLWGLFRHPVARRWHGPGCAILGDAAHPTLPFLAQGANMALEDAWTLAAAMDASDRDTALATWAAKRSPRCAAIVEAANQNAKTYHLSGPARSVMHLGMKVAGKLAPGMALKKFDWVYSYDATKA